MHQNATTKYRLNIVALCTALGCSYGGFRCVLCSVVANRQNRPKMSSDQINHPLHEQEYGSKDDFQQRNPTDTRPQLILSNSCT